MSLYPVSPSFGKLPINLRSIRVVPSSERSISQTDKTKSKQSIAKKLGKPFRSLLAVRDDDTVWAKFVRYLKAKKYVYIADKLDTSIVLITFISAIIALVTYIIWVKYGTPDERYTLGYDKYIAMPLVVTNNAGAPVVADKNGIPIVDSSGSYVVADQDKVSIMTDKDGVPIVNSEGRYILCDKYGKPILVNREGRPLVDESGNTVVVGDKGNVVVDKLGNPILDKDGKKIIVSTIEEMNAHIEPLNKYAFYANKISMAAKVLTTVGIFIHTIIVFRMNDFVVEPPTNIASIYPIDVTLNDVISMSKITVREQET